MISPCATLDKKDYGVIQYRKPPKVYIYLYVCLCVSQEKYILYTKEKDGIINHSENRSQK